MVRFLNYKTHKKYDCDFINKIKEFNSKRTYEIMSEEYGIKPKIEKYIPDCTPFYTNIHHFLKDTRLKELNYKILIDGLFLRGVPNYHTCILNATRQLPY